MSDDGADVVVAQHGRERRHAVGARVARRRWREAAAENHANEVRRRVHRDRAAAGELGVDQRNALARIAMALGAVVGVELRAAREERGVGHLGLALAFVGTRR